MRFEFVPETQSTIPIPENYKDCIELIRSDYYRYKGKKCSIFKMFSYTLVTSHFGFQFWFRLSSIKGWLYYFSLFFHRLYYLRYGLQIKPGTKVGYGLYLSHGFGIIVNPSAIIGNNCNLSQFSTIGSVRENAAIIGDNVYVGPSVCVVGNVIIQSDSIVGAGSVVTHNVPMGATVAGVPARVLPTKDHISYVNNRWVYEDTRRYEDTNS